MQFVNCSVFKCNFFTFIDSMMQKNDHQSTPTELHIGLLVYLNCVQVQRRY